MFHTKHQKGISLLFVVLITSLVLAIGLGISTIIIQEIKMTSQMGYSVTAFYAADSGIEAALYDLYQSDLPIPEHSNIIDETDLGASYIHYQTQAYCCYSEYELCSVDCPEGFESDTGCETRNYCLKSLGSYRNVERAIEIKY